MTGSGGVHRLFRFSRRSPRELESDIDAELEFHLEQVARRLRDAGWSDADARTEAVRQFGDLEFTRLYCRTEDLRRERGTRRMTTIDEFRQDVRYALRALRSAPGFTAAALLTLALGIGANTAIFSVVRGVLLEPLPFHDADRLVRIWHAHIGSGVPQSTVSEPDFLDWRRESRLAERIAGYWFQDGMSGLDLTGEGDPERLTAALVTDAFVETLGTAPAEGRWLHAEEHVAGRNRVAVLSHSFRTRRFGAEPSRVGSTITLNGEPFEIVGVMPHGFVYPAARAIDVWIPLSYFGPESIGRSRSARFLSVIARVKPDVSEAQLRTEISGIASRSAAEYSESAGWDQVTTASMRQSLLGDVRRPLLLLMAAVVLLLVIACVNIASLLLARGAGRHQELAVRSALGAGRGRLVRQLVTESLTLASLGGVLGILLSVLAVRVFVASGAGDLPRAVDIRVDGLVLAFTCTVALGSGLLFGLVPALRAASSLEQTLRAAGRGTIGAGGRRLQSGLVIAEVALALVLLTGAGLATTSFARLTAVDPGFDPSNALVVNMSIPPGYDSTDAMRAYYYRVLDAIRAVPGVQAAGAIRDLPFHGNGEQVRPGIAGRSLAAGEEPAIQSHHVSTDYFGAMGIPLRAGRSFTMDDKAGAPPVIVVNQELARRIWPDEEAVGKALRFGQTDLRVIGVVGDVRQRGLAEPLEPALYIHVLQNLRARMSIVVRTEGDPQRFAPAVREAIWSQDPRQTITGLTTLEATLGEAVTRPRLAAAVLGVFGVIGLTLGALGLFGVLAYDVSERQQEIGVRAALGAPPQRVLRAIVGRGLLLAGSGVAAGVTAALLLTRLMRGVLFGIEPSDPQTFLTASLVMMGCALLASWLPARRALAIDPATALRNA